VGMFISDSMSHTLDCDKGSSVLLADTDSSEISEGNSFIDC